MAERFDNFLGRIKFLKLPDGVCKSVKDLVELIEDRSTVQLAVGDSAKLVVVGFQPPEQTDTLWVETSPNGNFKAFKLFINGAWREIFSAERTAVQLLVGDKNFPPKGWVYVENQSALVQGAPPNQVFPARFIGY